MNLKLAVVCCHNARFDTWTTFWKSSWSVLVNLDDGVGYVINQSKFKVSVDRSYWVRLRPMRCVYACSLWLSRSPSRLWSSEKEGEWRRWVYAAKIDSLSRRRQALFSLTSDYSAVVDDCIAHFDACVDSMASQLLQASRVASDDRDRLVHRFECCERLLLRYGGKLHDAAFSNVNLR